MDEIVVAVVLMLVTWWATFRMASWLGGWNDREKE